ncbi:MAG TPA: hypothetical protein PKD61_15385 [Polyangiaceae bacterium]|nr:hypothetical protein [Polyangiaceae bacterium]
MFRKVLGCLIPAALCLSCSADDAGVANNNPATGGASSGGSAGSSSGGASGSGGAGGGVSGSAGTGGGIAFDGSAQVPVRSLVALESISFHERTGGTAPTAYTFLVNGPELTVRLTDPMTDTSHDIPGATSEFYDVYYSNEDGSFNIDGSYLTISGVFAQALPAGGGLNLAEIGLNFSDKTVEYGNYVASFVALGDNAVPANVGNCIDGDLQTHTTMGNTVGATERLRLTLGFNSTSGPPK